MLKNSSRLFAHVGLIAAISVSASLAQEKCGLCAREIVTNSTLATCFLQEFDGLSKGDSAAVAVDLSECGESRGVVEALPSPDLTAVQPSVKFMVTRSQLACLKTKLEQPDLVLDPSAKIGLSDCG
jgi:hypothetical protein